MANYEFTELENITKFFMEHTELYEKLEKELEAKGLDLLEMDEYDKENQLYITELMLSLKSEFETGITTESLVENPKHRFMNCRCRGCNKVISIDFNIRAFMINSVFEILLEKGFIIPDKDAVISDHECSGKQFAKKAILDIIGESDNKPEGADFYIELADDKTMKDFGLV